MTTGAGQVDHAGPARGQSSRAGESGRRTDHVDRGPSTGPAARTWSRWTATVTVVEACGFMVPALAAVGLSSASDLARTAALVAAGAAEGALLGAGQAVVLRSVIDGFESLRWVVVTSAAASVAWLLGMLPSLTHETWGRWPVWSAALSAVLIGALILLSIGTAQSAVLSDYVPRSWRWVSWSVAGWLAGLSAFVAVAPPLWHEGQPGWQLALVGALGGAAMAVSMSAVTGVGLVTILGRQP